MKILQVIQEEVVPLSKKQTLILLIIIACIFQFAFFYAPAMADDAVKQAKSSSDELISLDSVNKETGMNREAAKVVSNASEALIASSTADVASSTPVKTKPKTIKVISTSNRVITAYNSDETQTDDDPCTTANGFNVCKSGQEDTIAANFLPFGAKVMIPELFGERVFVVRDRMNRRHADRVDVWMKDYDDAIHFGVKVAKVQVVE